MAAVILGARGWECGNTMLNAADIILNGAQISSGTKHTGAYGLVLVHDATTSGTHFRIAVSTSPANASISVWIYAASFYSGGTFRIKYLLSTGEYIEARWNTTTHTFDAYVDNAKVASGSIEVSNNTWFHLQFIATVADSGNIGMKINGHTSVDYAGDTQPGAAAIISYIYVYAVYANNTYAYIDDLVWGTGGYLGDLRCVDIRPNADTAQDDWTPSAGDNYSTVDETPANDADYNETNTNAHADELALGDFDDTLMTPRAVVAYVRARMEGAFGDSLKVGIVSNAVEVTTTHALSTAYEYYTHTADEDPNGPIAWTDAAVDALLLRYEAAIA